MQKVMPCLWFDSNAEEAVNFYISAFKNSKILQVTHYGKNMPCPEGSVMTVTFLLNDQKFMALNGGPVFYFNEAISLVVYCDTQDELDDLWQKLTSNGGEEVQCGWLKDRYGVSWQVVPSILEKLVGDENPEKSQRVMEAIMTMVKLDIAALQKAYDGA